MEYSSEPELVEELEIPEMEKWDPEEDIQSINLIEYEEPEFLEEIEKAEAREAEEAEKAEEAEEAREAREAEEEVEELKEAEEAEEEEELAVEDQEMIKDAEDLYNELNKEKKKELHFCQRVPRGKTDPCGKKAKNFADINGKIMWFCGTESGGCYRIIANPTIPFQGRALMSIRERKAKEEKLKKLLAEPRVKRVIKKGPYEKGQLLNMRKEFFAQETSSLSKRQQALKLTEAKILDIYKEENNAKASYLQRAIGIRGLVSDRDIATKKVLKYITPELFQELGITDSDLKPLKITLADIEKLKGSIKTPEITEKVEKMFSLVTAIKEPALAELENPIISKIVSTLRPDNLEAMLEKWGFTKKVMKKSSVTLTDIVAYLEFQTPPFVQSAIESLIVKRLRLSTQEMSGRRNAHYLLLQVIENKPEYREEYEIFDTINVITTQHLTIHPGFREKLFQQEQEQEELLPQAAIDRNLAINDIVVVRILYQKHPKIVIQESSKQFVEFPTGYPTEKIKTRRLFYKEPAKWEVAREKLMEKAREEQPGLYTTAPVKYKSIETTKPLTISKELEWGEYSESEIEKHHLELEQFQHIFTVKGIVVQVLPQKPPQLSPVYKIITIQNNTFSLHKEWIVKMVVEPVPDYLKPIETETEPNVLVFQIKGNKIKVKQENQATDIPIGSYIVAHIKAIPDKPLIAPAVILGFKQRELSTNTTIEIFGEIWNLEITDVLEKIGVKEAFSKEDVEKVDKGMSIEECGNNPVTIQAREIAVKELALIYNDCVFSQQPESALLPIIITEPTSINEKLTRFLDSEYKKFVYTNNYDMLKEAVSDPAKELALHLYTERTPMFIVNRFLQDMEKYYINAYKRLMNPKELPTFINEKIRDMTLIDIIEYLKKKINRNSFEELLFHQLDVDFVAFELKDQTSQIKKVPDEELEKIDLDETKLRLIRNYGSINAANSIFINTFDLELFEFSLLDVKHALADLRQECAAGISDVDCTPYDPVWVYLKKKSDSKLQKITSVYVNKKLNKLLTVSGVTNKSAVTTLLDLTREYIKIRYTLFEIVKLLRESLVKEKGVYAKIKDPMMKSWMRDKANAKINTIKRFIDAMTTITVFAPREKTLFDKIKLEGGSYLEAVAEKYKSKIETQEFLINNVQMQLIKEPLEDLVKKETDKDIFDQQKSMLISEFNKEQETQEQNARTARHQKIRNTDTDCKGIREQCV